MEYYLANKIAKNLIEKLAPHCDKVEIVGELAMRKPEISQIEIVGIPKFFENGLFPTGIATVIEALPGVRNKLDEHSFRVVRKATADIDLHFFCCNTYNYGYIVAWANSPPDYRNHMKRNWEKKGYKSTKDKHLSINGSRLHIPTEENFFMRIGMPFLEPEVR